MQLSSICQQRNRDIIPSLLSAHHAVLHGDGTVVDLSTAENWSTKERLVPKVRESLANLSEEDLAYASGVGGCSKTRKHIAKLLNDHFSPSRAVDPSHIILAAGGTFALTALIDQICDPGDAILIAAPYWAGLDIAISIHSRASVIPVHIPLDKFFQPESVFYYEEALRAASVPVKGVLICNPHNPLGQCYPKTTLRDMRDFCGRNDLHLISDEVYALSSHQPFPSDALPFTSILHVDSGDSAGVEDGQAQVHVIYSLSKDFGCNGIRVGALVNQTNTALQMSAALSVHSQVSTLSTFIASNVLLSPEVVDEVVSHGGLQCRESYEVVRSFLEARMMDFIPVHYGVFVFARLAKLSGTDEEAELQRCLKQRGVSVSTGTSYHFAQPGWFRICYGMPRAELLKGLERLDKGVNDYLQRDVSAQGDN